MADLAQLEGAFLKAHEAGNREHAKIFADEIRKIKSAQQPIVQEQPVEDESIADIAAGGSGNLLAGAASGAAQIGSTLLSPVDWALKKTGVLRSDFDRRKEIESGLQSMGADTESLMFKGGELGTEIAGTLGAGGVLAQGVRALPIAAKYALPLASSLEASGFAKGVGLPTNIAGGVVSGGTQAAMVNPKDTATGMMVGGALPLGVSAVTRGIPAVSKAIAGTTSGVGSTPLEEAFKAGKVGGSKAQAFRENISGDAPVNETLTMAKDALENMRIDRSNKYKATIGDSFEDATPLDFSPIESALDKALASVKGKGSSVMQEVSPETSIWVDKFGQRVEVPETMKAPKLDNLLTDIRRLGGINISYAKEFGLTPQEAAKSGLFTKSGKGLDELSRSVEQKGWVGEHTLADADYMSTGGREGYLKDMVESAMSDPKNIIHPSQADDWFNYQAMENSLTEQGINKVTIPAKTKQTSGEYWTIGKDEQGKISEVSDIIQEWKHDPARHNVEGLDALKRRIGAVYPENPKQTQAQRVIDTMYNSVKGTIEKQAPDYASTMREYSNMTDQIREIEKSLSLGNKSTADTAMRKLQSLMRNNVSTNYGGRVQSASALEGYGAESLMPSLAGQALNELAPRGIARAGSIAGMGAAVATNPWSLLAAPIASPRAMGEVAYGSGVASRKLNNLADWMRNRKVMPSNSLVQSAIVHGTSN